MPPIVCVIGKQNSGKTTLVVRLVAELRGRGYRVMTVKHGHGFDVDRPGSDSWRHVHEGGAERVVLAAPGQVAVIGSWSDGGEPRLLEIAARFLPEADLVVAEGYKGERLPTIEVFRRAAHAEPIYDPRDEGVSRFLAVVADCDLEAAVPVYRIDRPDLAAALADLLERRLLSS